jgi:predicted DCC family thiol-disulfide oxidoreductase YuxK
MRTLTVLYDGACPLCVECGRWLSRRRQRIPLRLVDVHGEVARRTYARVPGDGRALVAVDDAGRYWVGPAAFLMCLWALERWALLVWLALRWPLRPLTVGLFALVSANRTFIASVLGLPCGEGGHCGVTPAHGGPYRSARLAS